MRRNRYDLKFERMAVNLWRRNGRPAAAIAAELAVTGFVLFPRQDTGGTDEGSKRAAPERENAPEYRQTAADATFPDTPRA